MVSNTQFNRANGKGTGRDSHKGFPGGSVKESTFKAGDTGDLCLIPGWVRAPGGGNSNPLQYSCPEKDSHGCEPCKVYLLS